MNDDIVKKLERNVDRRSFLRGSGLAAAAFVGIAAVSPLIGYAQEQERKPDENRKTPGKNDKNDRDDPNDKDDRTANKDEQAGDEKSETKLDAEGREYRSCPQCGSNMYRQGRTWTCENCGYSYVE